MRVGVGIGVTASIVDEIKDDFMKAKVTISSANLLAGDTVVLIAGEADKQIVPAAVHLRYNEGGASYGSNFQDAWVGHNGLSPMYTLKDNTDFVDQGYSQGLQMFPNDPSMQGSPNHVAPSVGLDLVWSMQGAYIDGDGTIDVFIVYEVFDV